MAGAFSLLKFKPGGPGKRETGLNPSRRVAENFRDLPFEPLEPGKKPVSAVPNAIFRRIWLICRKLLLCYLDHNPSSEISAISCEAGQDEANESIRIRPYT